MAFSSSVSTSVPSWSLGPVKIEIQSFSMVSGDTEGTVTASKLQTVDECIVVGAVNMDVAPVISGKTVTLSFEDIDAGSPAHAADTDVKGTIILLGK